MDLDRLQRKLMSAARKTPPRETVPYAFEKRVMARLRASTPDRWFPWGQALWKGALSCVGVTLLIGLWSAAPFSAVEPAENLSQDFENAVYSSIDSTLEDVW